MLVFVHLNEGCTEADGARSCYLLGNQTGHPFAINLQCISNGNHCRFLFTPEERKGIQNSDERLYNLS